MLIMTMTTSMKAHFLKKTIELLKDESNPYYWSEPHLCQAGYLCQAITGLSPNELEAKIKTVVMWGDKLEKMEEHFRQSEILPAPTPDEEEYRILVAFMNSGFASHEIHNLEWLVAPGGPSRYSSRKNCIEYLGHWVKALESLEQDLAQSVTP